ncbi:MAG: hypothetical protein E6Q61_09365 [Nitrosomonas sp.]|nr:MAG: hypothetical protein E6Q61_09365 [Nitrosomonas sp.]
MQNTENEHLENLEDILLEEPTVKDKQIERLQRELDYERDARREERFVCILVLVILLDVVFFSVMSNFGGPIALLILELLILFSLAKRMGMEQIAAILDRVMNRLAGNNNGRE